MMPQRDPLGGGGARFREVADFKRNAERCNLAASMSHFRAGSSMWDQMVIPTLDADDITALAMLYIAFSTPPRASPQSATRAPRN